MEEKIADLIPFSSYYGDSTPNRVDQKLHAHEKEATCVKFNVNGSLLATGGADSLVKIWDVNR